MDRLKYVVFEVTDPMMGEGTELIVIFPAVLPHSTMGMNRRIGEPVSAGFAKKNSQGWLCFGESESLKLKARPQDTALANRML